MYEEASQVANDAVGTIRTVASYCAEERVMELYRKKCEGPAKMGIKQGLISGTGFGLSLALVFFVYATAFYAGARLVEAGKTTFEDVFRVSIIDDHTFIMRHNVEKQGFDDLFMWCRFSLL